jgi:hypothetical protein
MEKNGSVRKTEDGMKGKERPLSRRGVGMVAAWVQLSRRMACLTLRFARKDKYTAQERDTHLGDEEGINMWR